MTPDTDTPAPRRQSFGWFDHTQAVIIVTEIMYFSNSWGEFTVNN